MFIRIDNVPSDITEEEIMALFNYSPRVKNVAIKSITGNKSVIIWVRLNVESRAVINGIADYINGRYVRGTPIKASAPLFFNEPVTNDSD